MVIGQSHWKKLGQQRRGRDPINHIRSGSLQSAKTYAQSIIANQSDNLRRMARAKSRETENVPVSRVMHCSLEGSLEIWAENKIVFADHAMFLISRQKCLDRFEVAEVTAHLTDVRGSAVKPAILPL